MASDVELDRLAAAIAMLRPTWPPASTASWLRTERAATLRARPIADLAVVLVACALDPANSTPAAVLRPGPWWAVVERVNDRTARGYLPGPGDHPCRRPGHEHEPADACRACHGERKAADIDEPTFGPAPEPRPCTGCARTSRFLLDGRCITCRTGTPTRLTQLEPAKETA